MITTVSDRERAQAATIETLRQEVTAWSVTAENLEAELERKEASVSFYSQKYDVCLKELAALRAQEPVARFNWNRGKFEWLTKYNFVAHDMKPLFLAAGAAPTDEWKDAVLNALASHAMDAPLTDTPREIVKKLMDMVVTMARDPAINAGAAPVPNAELAEALEDLMSWQVKNVKRWHNAAYDNAARVLKKLEAAAIGEQMP